jgi:hypothetical protein
MDIEHRQIIDVEEVRTLKREDFGTFPQHASGRSPASGLDGLALCVPDELPHRSSSRNSDIIQQLSQSPANKRDPARPQQ